MNLLDNSDFSAPAPPPTLTGHCQISSNQLLCPAINDTVLGVPTQQFGSATWSSLSLTFGGTYTLTFDYTDALAEAGGPLLVEADKGDGSFVTLDTLTDQGAGSLKYSTSYTALGATGRIRLRTNLPASGVFSQWFVDNASLTEDASVAIRLSERAVDEVVSLLQTNLGTELTAIDTERNDGLSVPVPPNGNYYKRQRYGVSTGTSHIEVWEEGFTAVNPYTDQDSGRIESDVPVFVRVTVFRRSNESADDMVTYLRRYLAGIAIVFTEYTTYSDDSIHTITFEGAPLIGDEVDADEDGIFKRQATVELRVRMTETNA